MASISASIGQEPYKTEIKSATNHIIADEPLSSGGKDLGFSPDELLASALGACTCATLRMYADRKGWAELTGINVDVSFSRDIQANVSHLKRNIELVGVLSEEQKTRLLAIANKCPMHQTLTHSIEIETALV
ncbi:putative redox protein [Pseudarcicella hirudinis]|uniref:Putative redox protein n=1 Tax=Pseudarcicella hirudinis TaxID=1079859 RepID=A0A1I5NMN4_9BACT|nr:OsmC family protein [Pseudarcicella hirudinis]SFP22967.1 putative redox protein [Pseudarcicella hirudinis]